MALLLCYCGSVNAWKCDENDHLNVPGGGSKRGPAPALGDAAKPFRSAEPLSGTGC